MAVVLKGLVFAWGTVLVVHVLSRRHDHLDLEGLSYIYFALTMLFSGITIGSDDAPNWILGVGLWISATGFGYSIRWQAERYFQEEQEPI